MRTLEEIQWLNGNGHRAWIGCYRDSAMYQEAHARGIPCVSIYFRGSVHPRAIFKLIGFCLARGIQLVHTHSSRDSSAAMALPLFQIPVIRSQHICEPLRDDFWRRILWQRGAKHVVVTSKSICNRLVGPGLVQRDRITLLGEFVNRKVFDHRIDGRPVRRQFGIPEEAVVMSVIGMIRRDKGQGLLLNLVDRIVAKHPTAWFMVVGDYTQDGYRLIVEKVLSGIQNRERVVFTGFQNRVQDVMAASDLIVLTSEMEAQSRVIPEAFAMKRCVVAPEVGGIPELLIDGKTGFLYPPGDGEGLVQAIGRALNGDRRAIIDGAFRYASKHLSLEGRMAETLALYHRILEAS